MTSLSIHGNLNKRCNFDIYVDLGLEINAGKGITSIMDKENANLNHNQIKRYLQKMYSIGFVNVEKPKENDKNGSKKLKVSITPKFFQYLKSYRRTRKLLFPEYQDETTILDGKGYSEIHMDIESNGYEQKNNGKKRRYIRSSYDISAEIIKNCTIRIKKTKLMKKTGSNNSIFIQYFNYLISRNFLDENKEGVMATPEAIEYLDYYFEMTSYCGQNLPKATSHKIGALTRLENLMQPRFVKRNDKFIINRDK